MKLREAFALVAAIEGCAGISPPPLAPETPEPIPVIRRDHCGEEPLLKPIENVRNTIEKDVLEILENRLQPFEYIKRAVEKLMENTERLILAGFGRLALAHYKYAIDKLNERLEEIREELDEDTKRVRREIAAEVVVKQGINPGSVPFLSPAFIVSHPDRENLERQLRELRTELLAKSVDLKLVSSERYLRWAECMRITLSDPTVEKLKLGSEACGKPPKVADKDHIIAQDVDNRLEKTDSPLTPEDLAMIVKDFIALAEKAETEEDFEKVLTYYDYIAIHLKKWHEKAKDVVKAIYDVECSGIRTDVSLVVRMVLCMKKSPNYKNAWRNQLEIGRMLQKVTGRYAIVENEVFEAREKWFLCMDKSIMAQ